MNLRAQTVDSETAFHAKKLLAAKRMRNPVSSVCTASLCFILNKLSACLQESPLHALFGIDSAADLARCLFNAAEVAAQGQPFFPVIALGWLGIQQKGWFVVQHEGRSDFRASAFCPGNSLTRFVTYVADPDLNEATLVRLLSCGIFLIGDTLIKLRAYQPMLKLLTFQPDQRESSLCCSVLIFRAVWQISIALAWE